MPQRENVRSLLQQDLRIPSICVGAIRESPLHLGLYFHALRKSRVRKASVREWVNCRYLNWITNER